MQFRRRQITEGHRKNMATQFKSKTNKGTSISQKRLRDLAPRAVKITERHQVAFAGVAEVATDLIPAAETYIGGFDSLVRQLSAQDERMARSRISLDALHLGLRHATAILVHRAPSFDTRHLVGDVDTPERLIAASNQVLEVLGQGPLGTPTVNAPAVEILVTELAAAVERAKEDREEAYLARVEVQAARGAVRQSAARLSQEINALRRVLRIVLGTQHLDYQALRTPRKEASDEGDDVVVEETDDTEVTQVTNAVVLPAQSTNGAALNGAALNGSALNGSALNGSANGARPLVPAA
jgi:hypothetical protein